jgi:hypothetical protein
MDASKKIFVAIGIIVFDFELFATRGSDDNLLSIIRGS